MHVIKNRQYSRLFFSWRNTSRIGFFSGPLPQVILREMHPFAVLLCISIHFLLHSSFIKRCISCYFYLGRIKNSTLVIGFQLQLKSTQGHGRILVWWSSQLDWTFHLCLVLCNPDVSVSLSWGRWARCLTWVLPVVTVDFVVLYSSKFFYNS